MACHVCTYYVPSYEFLVPLFFNQNSSYHQKNKLKEFLQKRRLKSSFSSGYHLLTDRRDFLGHNKNLSELLSSKFITKTKWVRDKSALGTDYKDNDTIK